MQVKHAVVLRWQELFCKTLNKCHMNSALQKNLIEFMDQMMVYVLDGKGLDPNDEEELSNFDCTLKSKMFNHFLPQMRSRILRELNRLQNRPNSDLLMRRIRLYLDSATKNSSLMIRVATVISAIHLEDLTIDDEVIGGLVQVADLL